ncbi:endolytic transglycosylase MltG [Acetobacter sp. AN02]|uniref:endolytic transglycosylase MltG n=1 Tax=Acetobacter sp. AN02 TaxID=2894186 RepID=UPI0024346736|nr:endolytic transglycosylase MltG [Acetobacter sp. AN02]MDG6093758.1 endolytic transglycosylase MltG [Acetobacter sp. AN02]
MRRIIIGLCLLVLLGGLAATGLAWRAATGPGPLSQATDVVIPRGGYASTISTLQQAGVLRDRWTDEKIFRAVLWLTRHDGPLHAAELTFPAHASMTAILATLRHGRPVQHMLTIPEGLTSAQIRPLIDAAPALTGSTPDIREGSILPQTYQYVYGTSRLSLTQRMQHAMARRLAAIWSTRDPAQPLRSPEELLTLASIVEKETGRPEERPMVARVFLNRLEAGMKLQSDPTTIYGLSGGAGKLGRPLTHQDMSSATPWNTYIIAGLPPGPVCSPGEAALAAVAHPEAGRALYFVAMPDGTTRFSETLTAHNVNVAELRKKPQ